MCFAQGQGGAAGGPSSASFGAGDASTYPAVGAANPSGQATTTAANAVPLPTPRPTVADIGKQLDKAEVQMQPGASDTRARSLDTAEQRMQSTPSERTMDAGTSTQSLAYRKRRAQDLLEG